MGTLFDRVISASCCACAAGALCLLVACQAVYPEVKTPLRPVRSGQTLEPLPPPDLRWIAVKSATIPQRTRDGRKWGNELGTNMPEAYVKLYLNGTELIRTKVVSGTLEPTWPDSPRGNFRVRPDDRLRVELWDARSLNDHPIGIREFGVQRSETRSRDVIDVECDSDARLVIADEPAHGIIGYGLAYEMRTYDVFVTRVYQESPASRVGIRVGDQIVSVQGKSPRDMKTGELQSLFNAPTAKGLELTIRHEDGSTIVTNVKEGAIYPLYRETGVID